MAWGDLPYACDAPYSRDITKFIGPTRVIGRLPDMTGASEPSHLLACLEIAATYKQRPLAQYLDYFALSAQVWKKSTALSLANIFGNARKLLLAPPTASVGSQPQARPAQPLHQLPRRAGRSAFLRRRQERHADRARFEGLARADSRRNGGGGRMLLWSRAVRLGGARATHAHLPVVSWHRSAYGYFGSTTIAYGPAEGNGAADLITQYFLLEVQAGHSLGLAALKAQQRYVEQVNELDPIDLKTLAQFYLLGDPSVQPVKIDSATRTPPAAY